VVHWDNVEAYWMPLRKLREIFFEKAMEILDKRVRRYVEGRERTPMKKAAEVDQALCDIISEYIHY
jgi:hypothetical protein